VANYIVYSSGIKPPKIKGEFPDIIYNYIANDSTIGFHYRLTSKRDNAYEFDDTELNHAKFIADCWNMKVKKT
jgi:hypothetical protein